MKVGERGQVTIPKPLRDKYGIAGNADVDFVEEKRGILLVKRSEGRERIAKMRGAIKLRFGKDVDEYIEDIRGR
jgi:AbrB family looped-hinge helix DNA binding protein